MKIPTRTLERKFFLSGFDAVIGVDEVGMACLAGPVTVCAVAIGPDFFSRRNRDLAGMRDSKLLTAVQRERYAAVLTSLSGLRWEVASCSVNTIDEMNIYQASRLAMRNAIVSLHVQGNHMVLVDGNKTIPRLEVPQQAVVQGDRKVWSIAAASIIAKVHRDRMMTDYAKLYPGYGLEIHKGYPTLFHRTRLAALGPSPLHRRSFHWKPAT